MKYFPIIMLAACILTAGKPSGKYEISGTLADVESDTILVKSAPINSRELTTDTIAMHNGSFELNIGDSIMKQVFIYAKPTAGKKQTAQIAPVSFMLLPGQPVQISGSINGYQLKGCQFYNDYSKIISDSKIYYQKLDSLTTICIEMENRGVPGDSIRNIYAPAREWANKIQEIKSDFIKQNPDNDVSVYLMSQLPQNKIEEAMETLTDRARQGVMAPVYQWVKQRLENEKMRENAEKTINPGNQAPDFTLKDINNKDFSLSSLKGKYVVLDFWGSWCGWCIKGIPEMKKTYEKYKGQIEFVGIDCNDTDEKWKEAVEKHQLPWINVRNENNPDVTIMYGIKGYPTKIIIDPEGKIIKQIIGEQPEFYTFLESLMK